jgi:hypothetical protein
LRKIKPSRPAVDGSVRSVLLAAAAAVAPSDLRAATLNWTGYQHSLDELWSKTTNLEPDAASHAGG